MDPAVHLMLELGKSLAALRLDGLYEMQWQKVFDLKQHILTYCNCRARAKHCKPMQCLEQQEGKARPCHSKATQQQHSSKSHAKQCKAMQSKAKQSNAMQCHATRSKAKQSNAFLAATATLFFL